MANKFFSKIGDGLSKAVHGVGNAISNIGKTKYTFRDKDGSYRIERLCISREEAEALAKNSEAELVPNK